MQDVLFRFVEQMVLCPKCQLPELAYKIGKSSIKTDCKACGHNFVYEQTHPHALTSRLVQKA